MLSMMNNLYSKITLKLAGEYVPFLYNSTLREVYNVMFPGVPIHRHALQCGLVLNHSQLLEIVENKINEFELAIAKFELDQATTNFKDYSDTF